jgi:hypothetical protein
MITRDEAARLVERLVKRTFDGPLPAAATGGTIQELRAQLAQRPPAEMVDLHGRAMFAAASLEPEVRKASVSAREAFFAELGAALGTTGASCSPPSRRASSSSSRRAPCRATSTSGRSPRPGA